MSLKKDGIPADVIKAVVVVISESSPIEPDFPDWHPIRNE